MPRAAKRGTRACGPPPPPPPPPPEGHVGVYDASAPGKSDAPTAQELKDQAKVLASQAGQLASAATDLGIVKGKELASKGMGFLASKVHK